MKTEIIKINPRKPESKRIRKAAELIRKGELVAFPTETVYGLGASALNKKAVKKIFKAKGRPADNPLIVHIADIGQLRKLVGKMPKCALKLANKFWPGPLTLVLKKSKIVPKIATAGLETIAIRMPANKIALELIRQAGVPIAAPSANLSGKPSPTSAKHVLQDFKGKIPLIIDGGKTKIGLESTVLDLTSYPPCILRPGKIGMEQLAGAIGKVVVHPAVQAKRYTSLKYLKAKSPGMKYRHYAPNAKVVLVCGDKDRINKKIGQLVKEYQKKNRKIATIGFNNYCQHSFIAKSVEDMARNLFRKFREFDEEGVDIIIVEDVEEKGIGFALMNRLKRAASRIV